jgi:hypothetical protein
MKLVIYWIWVDCTISITIETFDLFDFTKKLDKVFFQIEQKCVKNLISFER